MSKFVKKAEKFAKTPEGISVILILVFLAGIVISPLVLGKSSNDKSLSQNIPTPTITPEVTPTVTPAQDVTITPTGYIMVATGSGSKTYVYTKAQGEELANNFVDNVLSLINRVVGLQFNIANSVIDQTTEPLQVQKEIRQTKQDIFKSWLEKVKERASARN
jgi:hypothetical protein